MFPEGLVLAIWLSLRPLYVAMPPNTHRRPPQRPPRLLGEELTPAARAEIQDARVQGITFGVTHETGLLRAG